MLKELAMERLTKTRDTVKRYCPTNNPLSHAKRYRMIREELTAILKMLREEAQN